MKVIKINTKDCMDICELCKQQDELRPYGPNGKWICFECGMKDEKQTFEGFKKLFTDANIILDDR